MAFGSPSWRLGLSSTRKTLTDWSECSGDQGLEIRRHKESLREPALFSLGKRRSQRGRRAAKPPRCRGDERQQAQAGMQGISISDKEKAFFTMKVVRTGTGSLGRFKPKLA